MSHFKDRLWSELVRTHGADLARISPPPPRSGRRPRMLAGTGLGLAAAGTAAALVLGTAGTGPAFAVTKNRDGSVTVSIKRWQAIPVANAKLKALGLRARIVQVMAGCGTPPPWPIGHPPPGRFRMGPPRPWRWMRAGARFDPRQIPPGRLLVIPASRSGRTVRIRPLAVARGQVPACLPMKPPPLFRLVSSRRSGAPWGRASGHPGVGASACRVDVRLRRGPLLWPGR